MTPVETAPAEGGVAARLVQAGLSILAEQGAAGLTLRRIAARAGVSHAAPAHHFAGLPGLLAAIAAQGFRMFHADLEALDRDAHSDPFDWLVRIEEVYLGFAARHPDLFRLMFSAPLPPDPDLEQAVRRTHAIHLAACTAVTGPERAEAMLLAIWALTHGYAMLGLAQWNDRFPATDASYRSLLRLLVRPDGA